MGRVGALTRSNPDVEREPDTLSLSSRSSTQMAASRLGFSSPEETSHSD